MKLIYISAFISLMFAAYLGGFITGVKKYFPYSVAQEMYHSFKSPAQEVMGWNSCNIKEIIDLPSNFSVIIGTCIWTAIKSKN